MLKRITSVALALLLVGAMTSCIFDPEKKKVDDGGGGGGGGGDYMDYTEKWHVLHNLELAYNEMDAEKYVEILDDNFISIFFPGDVGGDVPESWGVLEERESAREMLNKGGGREANPVLSISFQLAGIQTATWLEITPDQDIFPGETHWSATVPYNFFIDTTKDIQYITSGTPQVEFQVREQSDGTWRLVRWRDLANG